MSSKATSNIKSQPTVSCSAFSSLSTRKNLRFVTEFYDVTTIAGRTRSICNTYVYSEDLSVKSLMEMLCADQKDNWRFSLWDNMEDLIGFINRQNDVIITYDNEKMVRKYYVNKDAEVFIPCGDDDDNLWLSNGGRIVYTSGERITII